MSKIPSFAEAARNGFAFPQAREWILPNNRGRLAQDATLSPNMGIPAEFGAYIDPRVIEILTSPRNARLLAPEVKKGDWVTPYVKFRADEIVGASQPYGDYASGTMSGVNTNWFTREQYQFQTTIAYGMMELEMSAQAKIDVASQKQQAAANILDIDSNKFALFGVSGKAIYGLLNDPNLPASVSVSTWVGKTAEQIFNSILTELFAELSTNSKGLITNTTPLKLVVSPAMNVVLGTTNGYGITVVDMLNKYFTALEIVSLPELSTMTAGDTIVMFAPEVNGTATAEIAFGEKMRSFPVKQELSSYQQKFCATTYGGIVYQPFAFASIYGMDAEPAAD